MTDKDVIKSLMHLMVMNNLVEQINKNKIKISKDIYNRFFNKKFKSYKEFHEAIFKKNRLDK